MMNQVRIVPAKRRRKHDTATKTPVPLQIIANSVTGRFLKERLLGNLPPPVLQGFEGISSSASYPKGAILFAEGEQARNVFVLSSGRVKLTTSSPDGKALLLRIAEQGEMIGLPGAISGKTYVLTAEALEPVQVSIISRGSFMEFLRRHGDAALGVAEILNEIYHATFRELRYLAYSSSAAEKLARFLLDAASSHGPGENQLHGRLMLTHEEIAEMIGVARETVTRLIGRFRRGHLIALQGSELQIFDKAGVEQMLT